jgi:hypothetical protein
MRMGRTLRRRYLEAGKRAIHLGQTRSKIQSPQTRFEKGGGIAVACGLRRLVRMEARSTRSSLVLRLQYVAPYSTHAETERCRIELIAYGSVGEIVQGARIAPLICRELNASEQTSVGDGRK